MTQSQLGTLDPDETSGEELADLLKGWEAALHTLHSGNARPSYAVEGMLWVNNSTNPATLNFFTGTKDLLIGTWTTNAETFELSKLVQNAPVQNANQLLTAGEYELLNSAANIPIANYGRLRVEVFQNYIRQTFMPFAGGTPESMNCFFTRTIILSSPNLFSAWAAFNDHRRLAAVAGYRTMPDGTIEQWGSATVTGSLVISFPVAFAALPYSVVCTPYNNQTAANVMVAAHTESITASGFLAVSRVFAAGAVAPGNFNIQWRAVGK